MDQKISVSGILGEAGGQFSKNMGYIYYLLTPMFLCSLLGILLYPEFLYFQEGDRVDIVKSIPSLLITLLGFIVGIFSTISLLFFFRSGKKDSWNAWGQYFRLLPKYIGVSLLQGLMILGGLILLIIPGIYLAVRYAFVSYRTLENPTQPIKALFQAEARATEGNRMTILMIGALLVLAALLLGALFNALFPNFMSASGNPVADFLFELLITPFFTVVSILTYIRLTREEKAADGQAPLSEPPVSEEAKVTPEPII